MSWREPRPRDEIVDATCDNLLELAAAYSPILRYADDERFFPVLAESWLTHTSAAPWTAAEVEQDDLPADGLRRGTAVCTADPFVTAVQQVGGAPNASDRPVQLSANPGDEDAIANHGGDTFLNVSGWLASDNKKGDLAYLEATFSELAAALNAMVPWTPTERLPHVPHTWIPQPVNPTVYAEVEWAGIYPAWSNELGSADFPPEGMPEFDGLMALTYYYLYPARTPPPEGGDLRHLEGQWEAITLFFSCEPSEDRTPQGRPRALQFSEPPRFVAASLGQDRRAGAHPRQQYVTGIRRWANVERIAAHPVLYVASGTHRHFFESVTGTRWDPTATPPDDGISYPSGAEFPGMEMLLVWAVVAANVGAVLLALGLILLAVLFFLVALILLILWLISLISQSSDQKSGDPVPEWTGNDEASGDGPQGGSGDEPPAGGSSGPGPGADQPPGTPNAGSPTGKNTVSFDVRLINLLSENRRPTGFPAERPCERPAWWGYTGLWGAARAPAADNDWEDGMRRLDDRRRSWGYWNALALATLLSS